MAVDLKPHQAQAVKDLHNGAILWGGVGSGKTITSLAYYLENYDDLDIYVITTAKKRDSLDWETDAAKFGIGKETDATVAGVLTVDSWNNISKYEGVKGAFFIFDEQRLVGSGSWTRAFLKIARQNQWILLSATPGDTWLDYIPVFVANGFYKNRTEFLREHVVYNRFSKFPKVDRYIEQGKLINNKAKILVHMPYERHTTRVTENILVDHDANLLEKVLSKRWHVYEERPLRDVAELFLVMRKVVNSSSTRSEAIRSLMSKHPRLIVFYNFDFELEALRSLARSIEKEKKSETTQEHESCIGPNTKLLTEDNASSTKRSIISSLETTSNSTQFGSSGRKHLSTGPDATCLENPWLTSTPAHTPYSESDCETDKKRISTASTAGSPCPPAPHSVTSSTSTTTSTTSTPRKDGPTTTTSSSRFSVAEWNGHKHQPIPKTDSWLYLVQYQAGSEGWNCVETDAMVFYSLTYSYKNWHQAHGRIDRMNTPFSTLYYYVLMSNSVIDRAIWSALSKKKSFNESRFLSKITTTVFTKLPENG